MHSLNQSRVRDDEFAAIKDVMRNQPIDEVRDLGTEFGRFRGELLHRLGQTVRLPNVLTAQGAQQFRLVISGHTKSVARGNHAHHEPQHTRRIRPTVNQVANKDRPAPFSNRINSLAVS